MGVSNNFWTEIYFGEKVVLLRRILHTREVRKNKSVRL